MLRNLALLTLGLAVASPALADTVEIDLDFSSLPSAQSFDYSNSGPHADEAEGDVYSVSGGVLTQASFGKGHGANTPGSALYEHNDFGSATPLSNLYGRVEAKLDRHEWYNASFRFGPFYWSVGLDGHAFRVGLLENELHVNGTYHDLGSGFDYTAWHTYDYEIDLVADTWSLTIDGQTTLTGSTLNASGDYFIFGDGTGTGNADGQWRAMQLNGSPLPVPKPTTAGLLGLAGLGVVARRPRSQR